MANSRQAAAMAMNSAHTQACAAVARAGRRWAWLPTVSFLAGLATALLLVRALPPAPAFSPQLARATYLQSYETSYFATLRSYEAPISAILSEGLIPVVVFGDSTIRGTGATGNRVWTRVLEHRLQAFEPRVRVLNYAQNAGDLLGPFLFHHLQQKFPEARYIVQWHFPGEVGVRHPFHFWLTSEIALRDGKENPAIKRSHLVQPVWNTDPLAFLYKGLSEEQYSFVLAGLNIVTNYLDAGNWVRYLFLGRPFFDGDRKVKIQALRGVAESDVQVLTFIPPSADVAKNMRLIFDNRITAQAIDLEHPLAKRIDYFSELFPSSLRGNLLILTFELNPYYAPQNDSAKMKAWFVNWEKVRKEMAQITDLRWVSLTASHGELQVDDFMDLGHLTPKGQQRLADAVADNLVGPGGWFSTEKETKK
jgi:lysophospholipase L1-like esterase